MSPRTARRAWARQHAGVPYEAGAAGWLVAFTTPATETRREITTYWYGPESGWGTTSGPLEPRMGVRTWPTKAAAEAALRAVFGTPGRWRGYRPVRVADAEAAQR